MNNIFYSFRVSMQFLCKQLGNINYGYIISIEIFIEVIKSRLLHIYTAESRFYTIRYNAESVYPLFIHVAQKKSRKSVEVGNTQLTKIGV
jgi:hypothetical protein